VLDHAALMRRRTCRLLDTVRLLLFCWRCCLVTTLLPMLCAVIEKYTRNTRFCLICNYVSKIIPALQSRCTRFRFPPLDESHVRSRLQHVMDAEK
jgi:DNA polymerase III delta prime subunit